jgi:hypothetical protein
MIERRVTERKYDREKSDREKGRERVINFVYFSSTIISTNF